MTAEANRQNIERAMQAFNRHEPEAVRQETAPQYVDHEAGAEFGNGFDATRQNLERFFEGFPDAQWEVLDIVVDDKRGATRLRLTGTHRGPFMGVEPTGSRIDLEVVDFLHFDDDGKATAHWGYMDRMELMQQLGVTAVPTG